MKIKLLPNDDPFRFGIVLQFNNRKSTSITEERIAQNTFQRCIETQRKKKGCFPCRDRLFFSSGYNRKDERPCMTLMSSLRRYSKECLSVSQIFYGLRYEKEDRIAERK